MSLRSQIASLLIVLSITFVATTYAVQVLVVMPAFADLEQLSALRDVDRCVNAVQRDLEALSNTVNDWAAWDASYQYVQDHNETFAKENLVDESFSNTRINLICILDTNRNIVWGETRDIETLEAIDAPDLFTAIREESSPVTTHQNIDDAKQGFLLTNKGPILLASRPIITTKREGPSRGSFVMGRFLNQVEITNLAERTHTSLDTWTVTQKDMPVEAQLSLATCIESGEMLIEVVDAKTLHAYRVINDVYGKPAILLRVEIPRDITAQGTVSAHVATGCGIAAGLLTLVATWMVLKWRIVGPLQYMAAHAVRVGQADDLKSRLQFERADEIGTLAREFDGMVENLAESRKKVLDSAHRAGMAEIASEVLHNVGNAVNSANCSVEVLEERLSGSKINGLDRAVTLLREQAPRAAEFFGQDPRGAKLIDYLVNLNDTLRQEYSGYQTEVVRLRETIRHIRGAIAEQQTYAGRSDFRQDVDLSALLDEVLRLNQEQLRSAEIQVSVDLPPLPEVQLNKSKMCQVLVNLVRNAIHAMQGQPSDTRRLTIAVRPVEDGGIEMEVHDTGQGFDDAVRSKLFTHGFTTKPEGNGFGLHYCANAVREAGGHITALSPGPGQGATFRIRLPQVMAVTLATT
jgi:sensor domain CHASE-containing protein/HAMP domain-containing protein